MGEFQVGDQVQFLDELTRGVVLQVAPGSLLLRTEDGFEIEVDRDAVIHLPEAGQLYSELSQGGIPQKDTSTRRKPAPGRGKKARYAPAMEVDLHIEKLVSNTHGMSAYDMLDCQLETARRQLEFALRRRLQRVVFIHGKGEGVLKAELATLFRRYEGLQVREADYQEYGLGATEVYIPQDCFY